MKLSDISAAETLVILHPNAASSRELFKITFGDLLLHRVLKLENFDEDYLGHIWVLPDINFEMFTPQPHHECFTKHFSFHKKAISMNELFHLALSEVREFKDSFKHLVVYKSDYVSVYFKSSYFLSNSSIYKLLPDGLEFQKKMYIALTKAEQRLSSFMEQPKDAAFGLLSTVGSNMLVLDSFESAELAASCRQKMLDQTLNQGIEDFYSVDFLEIKSAMDFLDNQFKKIVFEYQEEE